MQVFLRRGSYMNLHTYVCFVYGAVHHFNSTFHRGRNKMEIMKGRKTKVQVFECILCIVCFTFEMDAAGKYLSPKSLL